MRNKFFSAVMLSLLMATAFFSCKDPHGSEPENDNVPSVATIDSLWAATDIFEDNTDFRRLDMSSNWRIRPVPNSQYISFELAAKDCYFYLPEEDGFCYLYFSIDSKEKSMSNLQGFYRTYPKKHDDRIVTGEAGLGLSSVFERPEDQETEWLVSYYVENGKMAIVKLSDLQYHVRFQVSTIHGDSIRYYDFDQIVWAQYPAEVLQ